MGICWDHSKRITFFVNQESKFHRGIFLGSEKHQSSCVHWRSFSRVLLATSSINRACKQLHLWPNASLPTRAGKSKRCLFCTQIRLVTDEIVHEVERGRTAGKQRAWKMSYIYLYSSKPLCAMSGVFTGPLRSQWADAIIKLFIFLCPSLWRRTECYFWYKVATAISEGC